MKFCVIGVGRLGYYVATTLADNGMEVLAVDSNEATIESLRDKVSQAICMRIKDEDDLRTIGIADFDVVIVAMGENFEESILVTALLKQNVKIKRVITRAIDKIHKDILHLVGADQVVLPERDAGIKLADALSLSFATLIRLAPTFSLTIAKPPKKCIGQSIECITEYYSLSCVGKKVGEDIVPLHKDYLIKENDMLVYAGDNKDLEKIAQ